MNLIEIEKKWQKKWQDAKIFEPNVDDRKKFFVNFPYPYINAYPHIGHFFSIMRTEVMARYKRLKGFNVLFPQGWHATGSPIVNQAQRVAEGEPKQIKILKDQGFSDEEIERFKEPEEWARVFSKIWREDLVSMGMSIDWRRNFMTTSLNPHYDRFITWQFNTLQKKGYVGKGKHPVVWCPKCNSAVGDHSRVEGEGETPQEFCLFKFKLDDGNYVITATLRHDTIWGITNLYVNPEETYNLCNVDGENWIIGEPIIEKLNSQDFKVEKIGTIDGIKLVGKKVESFGDKKVPILPATFLDINYGTGMVHSVPSDSADDLIALHDIQNDDTLIEKYNLDKEEIKSLKPIEIFETPGIGGNSAQSFIDKYEVKSQKEKGKLEKIKKELYKLTFTKSTLGPLYKKGFSKDLSGMSIPKGQEIIKKELLEQNKIALFYELTGKVVCRCLTPSVAKIVSDQWFLFYGEEKWKKLAHECLDGMKLFPEKSRQQFNYVLDWLRHWACTRESGLGTKLPWDKDWIIESLSDSTIYMAYYTIAHIIKDIDPIKIDDKLFDFVFLGHGKKDEIEIDPETLDKMKVEFDYWYPFDFRNSGKDLIQNHLSFCIFNHTAIFPKDKWPKSFGVNGWVTVDGQKMSKSLGNMIPLRKMRQEYMADCSRMTILAGGEDMDDPNWDSELAKSLYQKLMQIHEFSIKYYGQGREDMMQIDKWMLAQLDQTIRQAEEQMELTSFRSALQTIFFELQRKIRWYLRRTADSPNKGVMDRVIESQLIMLSPYTPHICEEIWEKIGKEGLVSVSDWPKPLTDKDDNLLISEDLVQNLMSDINQVKKLTKKTRLDRIKLFVANTWKYSMIEKAADNEFKDLVNVFREDLVLKTHMNEIMKIMPKFKNGVDKGLNKESEISLLNECSEFLKAEFGAEIEIIDADKSDENKAKVAMPGKPAILV